MNRVTTYLNFQGQAEEALQHYSKVFGTEMPGDIFRMEHMVGPDAPPLTDAEKQMIGHAEMEIHAGHRIMATDMVESMGQKTVVGNNTTLNLETDSRDEADRLYDALSDGGSESTGMQDMPWGYWGCTLDRFGIRWMFNVPAQDS